MSYISFELQQRKKNIKKKERKCFQPQISWTLENPHKHTVPLSVKAHSNEILPIKHCE